MRTALWVSIIVVASVFAGLLGYATSSRTGVEPGYFEAAEAGGYGAAAGEDSGAEGMDQELQEYYENLKAE
ncbi:MAG: hypothetical protein KAJ11_17960 [Alphaproteobacteria bacterium]|nr:hypothetical protein [Alphaproteobacteria bacterium]